MVLWFNVCDKEHLALRNIFRVTKKFLITKFDCTFILLYTRINFDFSKYKNANVFIKIGLGSRKEK